ncbi:MAG: hypothetical protein HUJ26_24775 [Planctomycetaceae bacterium]|nr:hypothetical protein [Planctomycetaceae bacterium]
MMRSFECPRCGVTIQDSGQSYPEACPICHAQLDVAEAVHLLDLDAEYQLNAPPQGMKAEVIEATQDRLMLSIPEGGKRARSLGCFGMLWLLITGAVTSVFAFAGMEELAREEEWGPYFVFGILSLFWLVGLGMLYFAVKLKYTRGYLFLSRERAVHQSIFFSRKTNTEIILNANSHARLVESYQENESPVYRIKIDTDGKDIHFGTGLPHELKEWYVETINRFLAWAYGEAVDSTVPQRDVFGNVDRGSLCPMCGAMVDEHQGERCQSCGARWEWGGDKIESARLADEISPDALSPSSLCSVSRTKQGAWELTYAIRHLADNSSGIGAFLIFGLLWEGFISFFTVMIVSSGDMFGFLALLFTIPFHLIGILLLTVSVFAMFGKFRLTLTSDRSSAKWGIGPLGYTMRFATSSITDVYVKHGGALSSFKNTTNNPPGTSTSEGVSCILLAAGKRIPVTSDASYSESREIAGVIHYCLRDLGHRLQDE